MDRGLAAEKDSRRSLVGADQATVGDGDPVGVAAEIGENMFGRAERWLGIDDPVLATKLPDRDCEGMGITEPVEGTGEARSPRRIGRLEPLEEQLPEQVGDDMDGQEEAWPEPIQRPLPLASLPSSSTNLKPIGAACATAGRSEVAILAVQRH